MFMHVNMYARNVCSCEHAKTRVLSMATPTRRILREKVQKRLVDDEQAVDYVTKLFNTVSSCFKSLDARIVLVETEYNQLCQFLEVAIKTKHLDANIGPLETVRVVFDRRMHFKVYFFAELIEMGTLQAVDDVANLTILKKMNSNDFITCSGVKEYSEYKKSIGYDSKNVVHVVLPTDTVRHVSCEKIFDKSNHQRVGVCKSCLSLKMYLTKMKRKHESDNASTSHANHQQSSSVFPYDFLSPASKKARMVNI